MIIYGAKVKPLYQLMLETITVNYIDLSNNTTFNTQVIQQSLHV